MAFAHSEVRLGEAGIQTDGALKVSECLGRTMLVEHRLTEIDPGFSIFGIEPSGPFELQLGGFDVSSHQEQDAEIVVRVTKFGVIGDRVTVELNGCIGVAFSLQNHAQVEMIEGIGWASRNGLSNGFNRGAIVAILVGEQPENVIRFRVVRLVPENAKANRPRLLESTTLIVLNCGGKQV